MASGLLAPELLGTKGLERDPRGYLVKPGSPGEDFAEPSLERSISGFQLQPGLTSSIRLRSCHKLGHKPDLCGSESEARQALVWQEA